jgi:hypothetical protein
MSFYLSRIRNHLYHADFKYHLLKARLKDKKNLKSQNSFIKESLEEIWSILFTSRDTMLMKEPRNLSPILVML